MHLRILFALLPFLLSAFNAGAGDNSDGDDDGNDGDEGNEDRSKSKIEWTPEQQAEISKIAAREARKAAQKAREARDAELTAEQAQREQEAQRRKDEEAGKFDEVRKSLESERDGVAGERDTLKARVETLEALAVDRLKALLDDIPKEIADLGPSDDTPIEKRLEWAEKAAKAAGKKSNRGNGPDFRPSHSDGFDVKAETEKARATGKYSV